MKKIASFASLSLACFGLAAGCAVDMQDEAYDVGTGEEAMTCNNLDGTNAMLASLAAAIGTDLGRWQILQDFQVVGGYNGQQVLKIRDTVRSAGRCKNACRNIDWILAWQDSRANLQFTFKGGQKLNSWTFASRLVTGYNNQQACENRPITDPGTCRIMQNGAGVPHYISYLSKEPFISCNGQDEGLELFSFTAMRGNADGSVPATVVALPSANELRKKLVWAFNGVSTPLAPDNQVNPYLVFSSPDNMTVKIDPGGDTVEQPAPPPQVCVDACQMPPPNPLVDLTQPAPGTCCTCNGVAGFMKPWVDAPKRIPAGTYKCYPG